MVSDTTSIVASGKEECNASFWMSVFEMHGEPGFQHRKAFCLDAASILAYPQQMRPRLIAALCAAGSAPIQRSSAGWLAGW